MREIPLTQGKVALVDDADYEWLSKHKWYCLKTAKLEYAAREENGTTVYMHREILGFPKGVDIDHFDGDGLRNVRNNLRICSHEKNLQNRRDTRLFRTALHAWARKNGRPIKDMAQQLGVSISYLSNIAYGRKEPTDSFMGRFLRIYGPTAAAEAFGLEPCNA